MLSSSSGVLFYGAGQEALAVIFIDIPAIKSQP
jgi:hypothetical protein